MGEAKMTERYPVEERGARRRGRGRAAAFLLSVAALVAALAGAAAAAPVKLALFDFELEDASAGPASGGASPADAAALAQATNDVRQLLAQSGRYELVDVGGADAAEAKAHRLGECNGCDAAIARTLGAEQSLVGVVRRISRTEYVVRLRLRDAATAAIVADLDSGLRMGADYSWNRGAARLVKDRLLQTGD
jgi:hypothetical protein